MSDFTQVNNYQDKLLEAMNIVSSQLINSIPYDKTITCTIIDDQYAAEGKYIVSNGKTNFEAYTDDTTLKKDVVVYVTIPEGNYDNQKMIIGKKTATENKPYNFVMPMDTMLSITNNILNESDVSQPLKDNKKLIANNRYKKKTTSDQETIIFVEDSKVLYDIQNLSHSGYSKLGIKAKFKTNIPRAITGRYGLKITIMDEVQTTTNDQQEVDVEKQTKVLLLDTSDMYGNPYAFETFYSQEKVFPIDDLNTIKSIKIEFYQIGGSFINEQENLIPFAMTRSPKVTTDPKDNTITQYTVEIGNNIFVEDIELYLGYDVSQVSGEYVLPVMKNSSMSYADYRKPEFNKKEFDLRWVHQFEDGPRVVSSSRDFSKGELENCQIRWYRYKLGAASADEYSGIYWTRLYANTINGKNVLQTTPLKASETEQTQALENIVFDPDVTTQTEQLKAILFYGEDQQTIVRGPVITFNNEESKIGQQAQDYLNALEIYCEDGSFGNYFIYNEAGGLLNDYAVSEEKKISCNFAESGTIAKSTLNLDVDKGDSIVWKFPIKNSMLSIQRCGWSSDGVYKLIVFNEHRPFDPENETYYIPDNDINTEDVYVKYNHTPGTTSRPEELYEYVQQSNAIDLNKVWIQQDQYDGNDVEFQQAIQKNDIVLECLSDRGKTYTAYTALKYKFTVANDITKDNFATKIASADGLYNAAFEKIVSGTTYNEQETYYIREQETRIEYRQIEITEEEFDEAKEKGLWLDSQGTQPVGSSDSYKAEQLYYEQIQIPIKLIYYKINKTNGNNPYNYDAYYEPWNIYQDFTESYLILQNDRTIQKQNNVTSILYPTYKIGAQYGMNLLNNTVTCSIRKDRTVYTTEKTFQFGVAGTMGTSKTITVGFVGGQTAITAESEEAYQLYVKMYDESGKEEDLSQASITWTWYTPGFSQIQDGINTNALYYEGATEHSETTDGVTTTWRDTEITGIGKTEIGLEQGSALGVGYKQQIYIAKVIVGSGDAELITYFPIPIKSAEQYSSIAGPTSIIYLSNGEPTYYKGDYKLFEVFDNKIGSPDIYQVNNVAWELIYSGGDSTEEKRYLPTLAGTGEGGLSPISIYTENVCNYAVVAKDNTGEKLWCQPILAIKNAYPSRVINQWDGKTLTIDEATGKILATAIAAGKKDSENRFTGVMIGDWEDQISDTSVAQHTGVYGFHQGAQSYAFKDDGTGFIGKNAVGRIEFDGNKATISSANFNSATAGMMIDFNGYGNTSSNIGHTPSIQLKNENSTMVLSTAANGSTIYMNKPRINNNDTTGGSIRITNDTNYKPLEIMGNKTNNPQVFSVDWDGKITANSGSIGSWDLEEVQTREKDDDTTETYGGRLKSNISGSWDSIVLDPINNMITGGKFKASILESSNSLGQAIKLGGAIDVYDPSVLIDIKDVHSNTDDTQIYYDTRESGEGSKQGYVREAGGSIKTGQSGRFGGTLGFMTMNTGSATSTNDEKDFQPAGIGLKANGGAELKVTNQNVGMNIKNNYLFLADYKGEYRDSAGNKITGLKDASGNTIADDDIEYSMFRVSVKGLSPSISEEADSDGNYTVTYSRAQTEMVLDGSGLSMTTGNKTGRIIVSTSNKDPHTGIGYRDSYITCGPQSSKMFGAKEVALGTYRSSEYEWGYLIDGKAGYLNIGRTDKTNSDGTKKLTGTTTTVQGNEVIIKPNKDVEIDTVGYETTTGTKYGTINIGTRDGGGMGTDSINIGTGTNTIKIGRYKTTTIDGVSVINKTIITTQGEFKVGKLTLTSNPQMINGTTEASLFVNSGGKLGLDANTTLQVHANAKVNFNNCTQLGIRAQFA